jgi:hypothetical protein
MGVANPFSSPAAPAVICAMSIGNTIWAVRKFLLQPLQLLDFHFLRSR